MNAKAHTVVGLGELLWDLFPEGKQLGGAPANFAYMTSLLGDHAVVASRIGSDALGRAAGRRLEGRSGQRRPLPVFGLVSGGGGALGR